MARAFVRTALVESSLTDVMEEALLLTAELSTNVVRHTGSNLDLEVATDWRGVTVTVADHAPGGLGPAQPDEGGYGLMLVDKFSHSWGVHHHAQGKAVWFRLEVGEDDAGGTAPLTADAALAAVEALLNVEPDADLVETAADYAHRLLECLAEWLPAESGAVTLDTGGGPTTLASFGPPIDEQSWSTQLPVTRPWSGRILLSVPRSAHAVVLTRLAAERLGIALERQRLKEIDDERRTWLTFVAEASELLAQSLDPALTAALIPRLVVPRLGSWCAVYTIDDSSAPRLATATHIDEAELPVLLSTLEEQISQADVADWLTPLAPPAEGYLMPLVARGQRLGLLAVGRHEDHRHQPDELSVVGDLARRAALAIDNARIHHERRRIAQALQQSLLPPALPEVDGLELGAQYVPIGDDVDVGGDFYDAIPMSDGQWLLVVGDVSGKGIQAANVTGLVRDVIRVLVRDGRPLESILDTLNEMLFERGGRYCTLALATVAPGADGTACVTLHLAGHDQPMLVTAGGAVTEIGAGGTAVGLLKELSSPRTSLVLRPGESIVFYTDGVTERRRHDEFFGIGRLKQVLTDLSGYPAEVIAARLGATVLGFSNEPPRDDIAILVLRNTP